MAGAARRADLADDREDDVLGGDAVRQFAVNLNQHVLGFFLDQRLGCQHMLDLGGADAVGQRAESAMGGGVAVAADNRHARQGKALLRPDDVDNALALVMLGIIFNAEFAGVLGQRLDLDAAFLVLDAVDPVFRGRHIVVHHGEGLFRGAHLAAGHAKAFKGLGAGHFMDQMAVDIKERGTVLIDGNHVVIPDLVIQGLFCCLGHLRHSHLENTIVGVDLRWPCGKVKICSLDGRLPGPLSYPARTLQRDVHRICATTPLNMSGQQPRLSVDPPETLSRETVIETLLSPVILFFLLGAMASFARSDLSIPEAIAKGMSLYLMAAIGLKGGVEVAEAGFSADLVAAALAGLALSFLIPVGAFFALRGFGRLDAVNAAAVAAHYGSVSVVTFVTGAEFLTTNAMGAAGYMVAVLALMETPAIIVGLFLASHYGEKSPGSPNQSRSELLRETLLNGSVVLLTGSFLIGLIIAKDGFAPIAPFFESGFRGILCLFLLDMGLVAARRLREARSLTLRLTFLAILFPLVNGTIGALLGALIGLDTGSAAALAILAASASYIAVPAAMRLALPQADLGPVSDAVSWLSHSRSTS